MPSVIACSSETVEVIPHPIHGDWTLRIVGDERAECFCRWPADKLSEAITYASKHFAKVNLPPRPAPAPALSKVLSSIQSIFTRS